MKRSLTRGRTVQFGLQDEVSPERASSPQLQQCATPSFVTPQLNVFPTERIFNSAKTWNLRPLAPVSVRLESLEILPFGEHKKNELCSTNELTAQVIRRAEKLRASWCSEAPSCRLGRLRSALMNCLNIAISILNTLL
jgi:hypothetical protein